MKKTVFILGSVLLVAGIVFSSCDKNSSDIESGGVVKRMEISVAQDDAATKTQLSNPSEHVYQILWSDGDKISINGTMSSAIDSKYIGQKVADFTVQGNLQAPFKVLYPGTTSPTVISLPSEQYWVEDDFDSNAAACYGTATKVGSKYSVDLNHFCGLLRFELTGDATLDRIEINSLGSEKLYGDFTLATDANGFTGDFSGGTTGTLTYYCDVTLSGTSTYFYVAIPAQTYTSGLEALVYNTAGTFMRLKFWGSGHTLDKNDVVEFVAKEYAPLRAEDLFTIADLTAEEGGVPTAEAPGITVATFNVMRLDSDNRPATAINANSGGALARPANAIVPDCAEMQETLGKAIYATNADLIGFQEVGDDMYSSGQPYSLQDIANAQGASYNWGLNYPGSKSGNYHYCNGFAYKSSVLTLNDSGRAWLRTDSSSYSTSSDSGSGDPNRYVVWALFTHKVSGKQFYFFVSQLPTYGQDGGYGTSNLNMSGGVNAFAASKDAVNRRIFVGDTNSADHASNSNQAGAQKLKEYWTDAYEAVNDAGNLSSFYQTYSGTQTGTAATYHYSWTQFTKNHPERRVDHIMTNGNCTARSYRTVRNTYTFGSGEDAVNCAPSDHFPVVAYITLD